MKNYCLQFFAKSCQSCAFSIIEVGKKPESFYCNSDNSNFEKLENWVSPDGICDDHREIPEPKY